MWVDSEPSSTDEEYGQHVSNEENRNMEQHGDSFAQDANSTKDNPEEGEGISVTEKELPAFDKVDDTV